MSFKIFSIKSLAPQIKQMEVMAPLIARKALPGQFVVLRINEKGERIPLTVADTHADKITLIFQEIGRSTKLLGTLNTGDEILDLVGPLGRPAEIKNYGRVVAVGGGVGTAVLFPEVRALQRAGNEIFTILGARSRDLIILENELKTFSQQLFITTNDGSYGIKGLVTDKLKEILDSSNKVDLVLAIGPVIMMKAVSDLTRPYGIKTLVSLNTLMVDGTGMCGACRCAIDGKTQFTCVDGPEFDGHKVNFDQLLTREKMYRAEEQMSAGVQPILCGRKESVSQPLPAEKIIDLKSMPVKMNEQPVSVRIKNFNEVALGLTRAEAEAEAGRCLQCKNSKCVKGCPVGVDIPKFINEIVKGSSQRALEIIKEKNNLPAICGRVCPQEEQCEAACVLKNKDQAIKIGYLERYAVDSGAQGLPTPIIASPKNKKVAAIGAGPAGLTVAGDLAKRGYKVAVFESLHAPGGVLTYGIPEFRLPKKIVFDEVEYIKSLGVEIFLDVVVGKTLTIDDLKGDGYEAFFIGTGAGLPSFMKIPGENLNRVFSANEYLTRVNLMKAYQFPDYHTPVIVGQRVAVVGGGNVAMDSARCALRLGADEVKIVYRRTEREMPARLEEIDRARDEGIIFEPLTLPVELIGENGLVKEMVCQKMKLGEPDESNRPRPIPIPGDISNIPFDTVIVAIGQKPNPLLLQTIPGLNISKWGTIVVDEKGATNLPGVFAAGDIATGAATVIKAMGDGKIAAIAIDEYLSK